MKKKKYLAGLFAMIMVASALTGCGQSTEADVQNNVTVESDTTTDNLEVKEAGEDTATEANEEDVARDDQISFYSSKEDKGVRSVLITFDSDKLRIFEEQGWSNRGTQFELIGDGSVLDVDCEAGTVQELYDDTMNHYRGEKYTCSELTETTIGDRTYKRWDVLWDGEIRDKFFAYEMDNGLIVTNSGSGYDGEANFEDMLSYALINIEAWDGTIIRPPMDMKVENDGSVLTVTFDSGEIFTLDYDETKVELDDSRQRISCYFIDEQGNYKDDMDMELFISDRYSSFDEYYNEDYGWQAEYYPISVATLNGTEVTYAQNTEYGEGICWIEMADGYVLRGKYYHEPENLVTLASAMGTVFGTEVEEVEVDTSGEFLAYSGDTGEPVYKVTYDTEMIEIEPIEPGWSFCSARYTYDSVGFFRIYCMFDDYDSYEDYSKFLPQSYEGNSIYSSYSMGETIEKQYGNVTIRLLEVSYTFSTDGSQGKDTCFWIDTESGGNIVGSVQGFSIEDADPVLKALFEKVEIVE